MPKKVIKAIGQIITVLLLIIAGIAIGRFTGIFALDSIVQSGNAPADVVSTDIVELEPFVTNLNTDSHQNRYINVTLSLSVESDNVESFEQYTPMIRDIIIRYLSSQKSEDVLNLTENDSDFIFKDAIKTEINTVFEDEFVKDVLVTDLLIQ